MPQQLYGTQMLLCAWGGLPMLMEGNARWEKTLPKDRVTANLFFWSSELWSMWWHFLLVALDNLWMMCTGLLRTWHFLALPVYKAEPCVAARGIFSPTKPSHSPEHYQPKQHMDFMRGALQRHRKVFWDLGCGETPWWESSDGQKPLLRLWMVCCLGRTDGFFAPFRKWFCVGKFWKKRQDLSLPKVLLSHAGLWCWDGSQVFGLKPPTKVTVCTVCHNIMCIVPGTGFVTNWVMVRECPDPVSLIFLFKGPPATKALQDAWQRGGKSHRLSRQCWFWECVILHFSSHVGCFSQCVRLIPALCYLDFISHSRNCCSASTAVISAAKPLALPCFNLSIHFQITKVHPHEEQSFPLCAIACSAAESFPDASLVLCV